jgi:hypothetical protein
MPVMILVSYAVIIAGALVFLMRWYPLAIAAWLDLLVGVLERYVVHMGDAAQARHRDQFRSVEARVGRLEDERAALRWLQVALVTLPLGEHSGQSHD